MYLELFEAFYMNKLYLWKIVRSYPLSVEKLAVAKYTSALIFSLMGQ